MSSLNQPQEQAKQSDSSEDLQVRKGKTPVKTEGRRTARTPPEATGDEFERKISREDLRGKKGVPFKYRRQPRKAKLKEDQKQDSKHSSEGKKLMSMSSNSLETDTETTQRSEKQKKKLKKKGSEDPRFTALPCDDKNVPAGAMYMKRMIGDDERPLKRQMYYHGLLPRDQIERMLKKNGEFLVRETEVGTDNRLVPTLSLQYCTYNTEPVVTVPEYAETMGCRSHDDCQVSMTTVDKYRFYVCKLQLTHASGLLRREIDQHIARGEAGNQIMLPVHGQTFYDWLCCCTLNSKCEWAEAEPHPFPFEACLLLPLVRLALALESRGSLIDQLSAAVAQLECDWEQKLPLMELVIAKPDTNTRLLNAVVHLMAREPNQSLLNKLNDWSPPFRHMVFQRRHELNKHQGQATFDQFQVDERLFAMLYHRSVEQRLKDVAV